MLRADRRQESGAMPRPPRQEKLTWSLLKSGMTRDDALVEDGDYSSHFVPALTTVVPSLFVKSTPPHPPPWLHYLVPHTRGGLTNLFAASSGAVLLVEAAGRVFAITLGQGRHLLNSAAFESDFGLKAVLNTVMPDQLKSVDAKTVEENTLHTRREVSRNSSISAFGLDVSRDLLRAVTGKPQDESLGSWLTGSDSLGIHTRVQVPDLPQLAERLLAAYRSDNYKEYFDFIDFLRPEKSPARVLELEESLLEALQRESLGDIHLAAPEPLNWEDMDGFRFSTQPTDQPTDSDPRITAYLATKHADEISIATLKKDKTFAISASNSMPQDSWSVFQCLVYQVEQEGQLYVLSGGDWFRVNLEFKQRVEEDVARLTVERDGWLPEADAGTSEDAYNVKATAAIDGLCLDRKLVSEGGPDKMEICDILTRDGGLIHVKHRGSSSTLSHLFAQGLNSAERLFQDGDFRRKAREIVAAESADFAEVIPEGRPNPGDHEVTFVVITRSTRETILTLPFFSVVSLRAAARSLRGFGFPVSIAAVREQQ
jgi:uncharacterized protein (TIGR04141 family)